MNVLRKLTGITLVVATMLIGATTALPSNAAPDTLDCPEIVRQALAKTNDYCDAAGRNQACYGHTQLKAAAQPYVDDFEFEQEGDLADVFKIQTLQLGAMDIEAGYWGVSLMRLQANLPASRPRENITLLLFGETEVVNAVQPVTEFDVTVSASGNANIRQRPDSDASVIVSAPHGETLIATGRYEGEEDAWVRVQLPDEGKTGWVVDYLIDTDHDLASLDMVDPFARYYAPMQAFYFASGVDDAACPEAPNSGLLIQTPEGTAEVTFLINEVDIQLGSTVYFQADPGNDMTVSVVEGHVRANVNGMVSEAIAGTQLTVPIDEDGLADGSPSLPQSYSMDEMEVLPVQALDRPIVIADPLTEEELDAFIDSLRDDPAVTVAQPDDISSDDGSSAGDEDDPTGSQGAAHASEQSIHGGDNPGHGGTPPGQDKKDDKDK
jgi:hypothetical protein